LKSSLTSLTLVRSHNGHSIGSVLDVPGKDKFAENDDGGGLARESLLIWIEERGRRWETQK